MVEKNCQWHELDAPINTTVKVTFGLEKIKN